MSLEPRKPTGKILTPLNLTNEIERRTKEREAGRGAELTAYEQSMRDLIAECTDLNVEDEKTDEVLSIEDASVLLGVSIQTLRNWDKQGKLTPASRTEGKHRRYLRSQITSIRQKQMDANDIHMFDLTPNKLREIFEKLLASFEPEEPINLTIRNDTADRQVRFIIDTTDGFSSVSKTFNMKD
jgi:DNA-binding transcriptional MerR regulator